MFWFVFIFERNRNECSVNGHEQPPNKMFPLSDTGFK